ncbi:MAG TPA: CvpA family protein [Candidatus Baltobacteraceae bacterium]|nr:CvpA family protein [Candidatus Baltobacteraceae bacterium]
MHLVWPDIVIGAILLVALLKGYKRGFIMELAGAIALLLAFITPWFYGGVFDGPLQHWAHLSAGSAHIVGMFAVGVLTYIAIMLLARAVNIVSKLPILGLGNALAGGAVGLLKGAAAVWVVLYIALFFPLTHDIRADLHRSVLAQIITQPNARVDDAIIGTLPAFARPVLQPVFARHRV